MFKVAVAGLGFGAAVLVPAFRQIDNVKIIAISGRTLSKALTISNGLQIPFGSAAYESLLDFSPDAVAIALPPTENAKAAAFFLSKGIPVFCEKPIAGTMEDARKLVMLSNGITTAVDFQFAELAAFEIAKAAVQQGKVGTVRHVQLTWMVESYANQHNVDTWKRNSEHYGGVLTMLAPHIFYLMRWMFGSITGISVEMSQAGQKWVNGSYLAPDTLHLYAELEGEIRLSAIISNASPGFSMHRWEIVGTEASLIVENTTKDYMAGFTTTLADRRGIHALVLSEVPNQDDGRIVATASLARRFVSAARQGQQMQPSLEDGFKVQSAMETAVRSNNSRRMIRPED